MFAGDISITTLWLILAIVFILIEAAAAGVITIWFSFAALISMLVSFTGVSPIIQVVIFVLSSSIMLFYTRPIVKKYLVNKNVKTNAESLVDKIAIVVEEVDNFKGKGQVKFNGLMWTTRAISDDLVIKKGDKVIVKKIEGVKLIVDLVKEDCEQKVEQDGNVEEEEKKQK